MSSRRLKYFSARDWLLLLEACACLSAASVVIWCLPFRQIAAKAGRIQRVAIELDPHSHQKEISRIKWAVEAASVRMPWRTVCFQKGLAALILLRRRKLPAVLHYGIANLAEGRLGAHVWVTSQKLPVIGYEAASAFAQVATFPSMSGSTTG